MAEMLNLQRLAQLPTLHLDTGAHDSFEAGHCLNEAAAWLASEPHSDRPACVSPVLRSFTMRLNDGLDDEQRQLLLPFAARIVGTAGDGQDGARLALARRALLEDLLPAWLQLAGMDDQIPVLAALADSDDNTALREVLVKVRDHAWARRQASIEILRATIREALTTRPDTVEGVTAVAVAAAVAHHAAADAAAASVAADAAASAVASADTSAADDANAAAAADASAAAVAATSAASAAVASAVASADPVAEPPAKDDYWTKYNAAYEGARQYYADHPLAISAQIRDLADAQRATTLELLDAMIDPAGTS
jgi:hypothetical protein